MTAGGGARDRDACRGLGEALRKLPSDTKLSAYGRRVDLIVYGVLAAVVLVLGTLGWYRKRRVRQRGALVWMLMFGAVLVAVVVRKQVRVHPQLRKLERAATHCSQSKDFESFCKRECADAKNRSTAGGVSGFSRLLFAAVPLVFVFAALAIFSVYARANAFGRPRSARERYNGAGAQSPSSIAVFNVAVPPRPARMVDFKLREVDRSDDDDSNAILDPTCAICLADIWSKPVAQLPCGHRFHSECVSDWLRKAPLRPTCPLCKVEIKGDGEDDDVPV